MAVSRQALQEKCYSHKAIINYGYDSFNRLTGKETSHKVTGDSSKTVNGVKTKYYLSGTTIVSEETNGNITVYLGRHGGATCEEFGNYVMETLKSL